MATVGIRALKQNASAVVARAAAGERVVITDNGRPVAQMLPLPDDLTSLEDAGLLRRASRTITEVGPPEPRRGRRALGDVLAQMRDEDDR